MTRVGDLLVKIHDNPPIIATLDQLCLGCSPYPVPLNYHSKSLESLSSLADQSSRTKIVRFALNIDLACEELQQCMLDFLRILGRLDRGLCND